MHLFQSSPPGLRPGSGAGGREPEMGQEVEPGLPSWPPTKETVVPHNWTCRNTGWTPLDWAVRHEAMIQSYLESAVVTGTASERGRGDTNDVKAEYTRNESQTNGLDKICNVKNIVGNLTADSNIYSRPVRADGF